MINDDDCLRLVEMVIERYGCFDILDNNVGNSFRKLVIEIDLDEWDNYMEMNFKSMVLIFWYVIFCMIEIGGGSIINIASIVGVRVSKVVVYIVSKAGVIGFMILMVVDHGW